MEVVAKPSEIGEFKLIAGLAKQLARFPVPSTVGEIVLGIGDDAAILSIPSGWQLVATADTLVEGVHFRRDWTSPTDLGWKALAVNVSDIGAMGALPTAALVCLALPPDIETRWVEQLYEGIGECAARYGCPVAGGDTVRAAASLIISVTALGAVNPALIASRRGARLDDLICVTGTVGESAAGLALLRAGRTPSTDPAFSSLFEAHLRPAPPIEAARQLAGLGVKAMLDLSDGLASDLRRLSDRSRVGVEVEAERLPVSLATRRATASLGLSVQYVGVCGGEDYQYLFTIPDDRFGEVHPALARSGVTATRIGRVVGEGLWLVDEQGDRIALPDPGYEHFPAKN